MAAIRVANPEMAAAWDGPEGDHWTAYAERYERTSWRHWRHLVDAVAIPTTGSIIDVGCGTGRSTRDLARIAGHGEVLGIDLSTRMLERGREQAAAEGLDNVRFEQADAQVHPFRPAAADLATSSFGAMFFDDPVAAFRNIGSGLRAGGALALLAWRELSRNEWIYGLRQALAVGRELAEPPIGAPGPFGLADADRVRTILADSGYVEVALDPVDEPVEFGRDADEAFSWISGIGMTKGLLHDLDADDRAMALEEVRRLLDRRETTDGVLLGSSAWLITARVPK